MTPIYLEYHLRARLYDSSLGEFLSRDPIGFSVQIADLLRIQLKRPEPRMAPQPRLDQSIPEQGQP